MAIDPMSVYRIVADDSIPHEEKQRQIDALYGPPPDMSMPAIAPDAGADQRLAYNADAPFASPDAMPEYGMSGGEAVASAAPDVPAPVVNMPPPAPPPPGPAMSGGGPVTSEPVVSEPNMSVTPPGYTPPAPTQPAPPPLTPAEQASADIGGATLNALRGSRGAYVPAHDQPVSTTVQHEDELPQEMKDAQSKATLDAQILTDILGKDQAKAKEEETKSLENTLLKQETEETEFRQRQAQAHARLTKMQDEYTKAVKDTEVHPGDWWASKTTGEKVTTVLAAFLFGLARNNDGIQKAIEEDMAARQTNRDKKLGAMRSKIEDWKQQMSDPNAAAQMEMALSNRTAATELERLAANSASPEIRDRANLEINRLRANANALESEAWRKEHGVLTTQIAHVPGRTVGGAPGGVEGLARLSKQTGIPVAKLLETLHGGQLGAGGLSSDERNQKESEIGRTVTFPDGQKLYARNPGEAIERQKGVDAASNIMNAYAQLEAKLSKPGHSISRTELAEINTIIAQNMVELKNSNALGAITQADEAIIKPLSGSGTGDTLSMDAATKAGIQKARQLLNFKVNTGRQSLFKDPWSNARTGGTVASDVEVPK